METVLGIVTAITGMLWLLFIGHVGVAILSAVILVETDLEVAAEPAIARAVRLLQAAGVMTAVSIALYVGMQIMGVCQ